MNCVHAAERSSQKSGMTIEELRDRMLLLEKSPWPMLTLVVSLEAIFLSAFVMIGQNRQSAFQ